MEHVATLVPQARVSCVICVHQTAYQTRGETEISVPCQRPHTTVWTVVSTLHVVHSLPNAQSIYY